jgi:hypothetical protein
MAAERQIPGSVFVNETGTAQRQIPGGAFINETVAASGAVTLTQAANTVAAAGTVVSYQFARPTSDVTDGNWYNELDTQTNLYASIDESSASDTDYIYTTATGSPCTIGLGSLSDPDDHGGHFVRYRAKGDGATDLVVTLLQTATQIAQWTETSAAATFTDYSHTLSAAEAANITDYTALRLKFEAA